MLDNLHEQLGVAHGLAISACSVTARVEQFLAGGSLRRHVRRMHREATETRVRCLQVERSYGEAPADALRARAVAIDAQACDLMNSWFKAATGPLAAWTFLTMAEAGEATAWRAVAALAARAGREAEEVRALADWALPIHERHVRLALDGSSRLAGMGEPRAPRWG